MSRALLIYSTVEGQTFKIISEIAKQLTIDYDLYDISNLPPVELANYSAVLIGASVRYGHFRKDIVNFIKQHSLILNTKQSAFFGVCVTARKSGKDIPERNIYTHKLFEKLLWRPNLKAVFAGALYYPQYSLFDRTMIHFIMWLGGEKNHDMKKNYSYTNWEKVKKFAHEFAELVSV